MKQLARTVVYWPKLGSDIVDQCRQCPTCAENQMLPAKAPNNLWMLSEKSWSRKHIDHAINFLGTNWLLITDAYSKYPCIHPTTSTSTKTTTDLLAIDFAHFGYPNTFVTDNATTFTMEEYQVWCQERGIPYHPATNGAAERLLQTFKHAMVVFTHTTEGAARIPYAVSSNTLSLGYSPSE